MVYILSLGGFFMKQEKLKGRFSPYFKGVGELSSKYWSGIIRHAKKSKIEISIDITFAWNLFLKQERKCAISNIDINLSDRYGIIEQTASLDRIDSTKGYVAGNVQWVHKIINIMKSSFTQEYFIITCKEISHYA